MSAASASQSPLVIPVEGMTCASCVGRVEKAIRSVEGVRSATVNLATSKATIEGGDPARIVEKIHEAGYETPAETADLSIEGMTCASCVARVERALKAVPGISAASVNLATNRAHLSFLGGEATLAAARAAVEKAGYDSAVVRAGTQDREKDAREKEIAALRRALTLAVLATAPLVILEMGAHIVPAFHHAMAMTFGEKSLRIAAFLLSSLVQFGPGLQFYRKGWPALARFAPDMNSLVMLGTTTAWAYSVVSTFAPGLLPAGMDHTYFEAAATIVTLILAGRFFEARAKGRTSEAIRRLVRLQAKTARVIDDAGERDVPVEQVKVGDMILVRPGERIPVDGDIVDGSSFVDESMITGEPIPAARGPGDAVIGGAVNKQGAFRFRAARVGADTLLAQIVRTVEAAQGAKLPIQALVDEVAMIFVPAVMATALATFLLWFAFGPSPALTLALVNAVAVLIIACPCAMGLATPTSIMVGTGRAAELGILFRRGEALQALRDTQIVALDKTGTLTKGAPELTDIATAEGFAQDDVLALVASVESRSEHPVAQAIVAEAKRRGLGLAEPQDFVAEPGFGVTARVSGRLVHVGADRMMKAKGIDLSAFSAQLADLAAKGRTPLFAAIDGRAAAIIAVADPVKETTPQALAALRAEGVRIVMVTGDNRGAAEAIARTLGIDEVIAEVLPTDKADVVARLQQGGAKVAFVGDGVNDAPALAKADVGIAIGTGTDIAIESADVVLMSGDLRNVPNAIALSRATMRNIVQNLIWAFGYNVILIPVAAGALFPLWGVLLSPVFAGFAMAFSSVSVVSNALRLRRFAPPLSTGAAS